MLLALCSYACAFAQSSAGLVVGKWNCAERLQYEGRTSTTAFAVDFRSDHKVALLSGDPYGWGALSPGIEIGDWSGSADDFTMRTNIGGNVARGKLENSVLELHEKYNLGGVQGYSLYDFSCRRPDAAATVAKKTRPERTVRFLNDREAPVVLQVLDGSESCSGDVVAQETLAVQNSVTVKCALGKNVALCFRFKQNDESDFGSAYGVVCDGNDPLGTIWGEENQKLVKLSGDGGKALPWFDLYSPHFSKRKSLVDISGNWQGNGGGYVITQGVDSLNITGGAYGPAYGQFTGPYAITVTWPQVNATYTGTVERNANSDATRIVWDHPANNHWDR
jgi:hypothetical protein